MMYLQGNVAGKIWTPRGVVLHGTRSTVYSDVGQEYESTLRYVESGARGLGWSITVGDMELCEHMEVDEWGWHAREESQYYIGVEFAQGFLGSVITDGQIEAFCWWFKNVVRKANPNYPRIFVNHSDIEPGRRDGKTDVEATGVHTVRNRCYALLDSWGVR